MSAYNSGGAQDLTQDEQTLHHHAAMFKKDLEAYHAYSRSKEDWKVLFESHLARFIPIIYFCEPFSDPFRKNRSTFMPKLIEETQISPLAFIRYY
jgi:hypothetical protein